MPANAAPLWKRVRKNVRTRLMSGMLILVPFVMTIEEAFKIVIAGGIIAPEALVLGAMEP